VFFSKNSIEKMSVESPKMNKLAERAVDLIKSTAHTVDICHVYKQYVTGQPTLYVPSF
jgi:hypothetical protein